MTMRLKKNRIAVLIIILVLLMEIGAAAAEVPYHSYTYWLGYDQKTLVETKEMYLVKTVLTAQDLQLPDFAHPSAMALDKDENLYIIEDDVSRLTVLNKELQVTHRITAFTDDDKNAYGFAGASDICVAEDGRIYIADTAEARILVGDLSGDLIAVFQSPKSDAVPDDFIFSPIRVAVDSKDSVYVLSSGSTYGAVLYNKSGEFQSFFGANRVTSSALTVLSRLWDMWFMKDEQRAGQIQKIPYQFNDICIDADDFVYTVTGALSENELIQKGQIRCLSAAGKNILKVKGNMQYTNSDSFNFGDAQAMSRTDFRYIEIDDFGFIYALDVINGRIFVYDRECNLLSAFGGGSGAGTQYGTFKTPSALAVGEDTLYVADFSHSTITIFSQTEYGSLVKKADALFLEGKYEQAGTLFKEVLRLDKNSQLAYRGLAKYYLVAGDYEQALEMAKHGLDYSTYSQAFRRISLLNMKQVFAAGLGVAVLIITVVISMVVIFKKRRIVVALPSRLKIYASGFIHPFATANQIKYGNGGSVLLATTTLFLFYVFQVLEDTSGGFLYNRFDRNTYNSIYTFLGTVGIVILWSACYWAMSVIFNGKSRLREVFIISSYAMVPQIIKSLFFLIVSHLSSAPAEGLIQTFSVIMFILSGIVLVIGCMVISEFDLFKMVGTSILAVIAMGVVIFLIFMIMVLDQQFIEFVRTLYLEIRCKL